MYYVDSQRTLTRRESSLIGSGKHPTSADRVENEALFSGRGLSVPIISSESAASITLRPKGAIRKELVTVLFESMLDCIVDSWEVIVPPKTEESTFAEFGKNMSDVYVTKKKKSIIKPSKASKRSKLELYEVTQALQTEPLLHSWWALPDERAIIKFRNGNVYEGSISMKCMHGDGRFQWADGTIYLGQFKENQIFGKGMIQWKDDTWYEGDFVGNVRHGHGLYVDSRNQRSYAGGWHCGAKHGKGVIYYSETFKNSYDGDWNLNVRHGFGIREYCPQSGYKGEWDMYVREGKGLMIWPNHDFYRGKWKNGVMSGDGEYIWDAYYNNSLSLPSITTYRGAWMKGQRSGYGTLNLGFGLGSFYKGEYKNNKKSGVGKFVTNNGLILQHDNLFIDDNIGPISVDNNKERNSVEYKKIFVEEPYKFDICDSSVGLIYHVQEAIENIDHQAEIRAVMINDYIERNKIIEVDMSMAVRKRDPMEEASVNSIYLEDLTEFEESSLKKALRCYESDFKKIYYKYAAICNNEDIYFTPILIRLYLWQFYYDCNIHEKGLTMVDIDMMLHNNPDWLSKTPHDPFEEIYFWQFIHSLISVASRLYAKKELPGPKPDTILASGFRHFMECDVLPNVGRNKGRLVDMYGQFVPLKALYELYLSLGDPLTVRAFLCAVRRPPHCMDKPQPPLVETPDECLPLGRNVYIFEDEMTFVASDGLPSKCEETDIDEEDIKDLKLFNFGNLSSKAIIKIFANIFPQLCNKNVIMDLNIQITFFEFFEAFIACAEESILVKDEELKWREKFSNTTCVTPAHTTKHK